MKHPKLLIAAAFLFTAIHIHAQCIFSCPSNITVDATSSAGAVVNYPSPTISGSCGVINLILKSN